MYTKKDIIDKLPHDAEYWYAPQNDFTDDLMSRASRILNIKSIFFIQNNNYNNKHEYFIILNMIRKTIRFYIFTNTLHLLFTLQYNQLTVKRVLFCCIIQKIYLPKHYG